MPACLLLVAALTSGPGAAVLSLPPPPDPLPDWIPTDATDVGVGDAIALQDCGKSEIFKLTLLNFTATRGYWGLWIEHHTSFEMIPTYCGVSGGVIYLTTQEAPFSPEAGGCFGSAGGAPFSLFCLEPLDFDEVRGLHIYKLSVVYNGDPYHGHAKVRYEALPA